MYFININSTNYNTNRKMIIRKFIKFKHIVLLFFSILLYEANNTLAKTNKTVGLVYKIKSMAKRIEYEMIIKWF